MHFYNLIKELSKNRKLILYVDMDGVIACFDVGNPKDYLKKRPLYHSIQIFEKINDLPNIELQILSICKEDFQIKEKEKWLDLYAPFFTKRNILSKKHLGNSTSALLKANYLNSVSSSSQIALIDDDNEVLKTVQEKAPHILLYQDSELVD